MRTTHVLIPALMLASALAGGQAFAQATGTTGTQQATPQTGSTPPGTAQGTPSQSMQQQSTSTQNGNSSSTTGTPSNRGAYGNSRQGRATSGTHGNKGTLNANTGSSYPATGQSVH